MRELKFDPDRLFLGAQFLGARDEIPLMTPPRAITKPRIPMGVICDTNPPNNVATPRSTSPAPINRRFREGEIGFADSAETKRGSSVKRAASISSRRRFSRSDNGTGSE